MGRNRILIVGEGKTGKLVESHSGLTQPYRIENKYYTADLDIWVDEFEGKDGLDEWVETFCSEEAKEVRDAIGGLIYTFDPRHPEWYEHTEKFSQFVELLETELWEGVCLAVSRGHCRKGDELMELGFEHVNQLADATNQFGERDGIERIKEALEGYEWTSIPEDEPAVDEGEGHLEEGNIIDDIKNLKYNEPMLKDDERDQEQDVENLEQFMEKLRLARGKYISPSSSSISPYKTVACLLWGHAPRPPGLASLEVMSTGLLSKPHRATGDLQS
ncbi:hypothetical protein TRICI_001005 [Trichomonascus ciferrii]|uniref:Increased recombination centers protein 6 n=1 Tax=Trichomonascus ciferrii TaxID=44093 RepID=A0A642VBR6_9ASCO|nr:hypothetical protein TRICI_001005 [Trichomonascus ciferrii]